MSLESVTKAIRTQVGEDSGLDATVKFVLGENGVIFIDGASRPITVSNEDKAAECTIKMALEDFQSMIDGELDSTTAFMMGKLKVEGSMGLAMKLAQLL